MRGRLLENVVLPMSDSLLGYSVMEKLAFLRSRNGTEDVAHERLNEMLRFACENTQYYRELGIRHSADPLETLSQFPILTKQILRERSKSLLSRPVKELAKNSSSGSSGFQSVVYWSKDDTSWVRASTLLWWEWAGYRLDDPVLQTGITPNRGWMKSAKDRLTRTYYLQAFSHERKEVEKALLWAANQRSPVLAGYASSLYVLAQFAWEAGIQVRFKTAVSWGDKLFPHYRKMIEKAFGCRVHETYGSAEGLMMAAQKDLDHMYVMTPNAHIELLDDEGRPVPDGQIGHVVVTGLNAKGMPLIRYRIGDLAIRMQKEKYPQERELGFPLLEKVIGRDTDIVKTPSGRFLVVHAFTGIFEHHPEISQFQIEQNTRDGILIRYIPGEGFNQDILESIERKIAQAVEEPFEIRFEQVGHIPASGSGKPQLIVSKLK
jgi:phenylacetate-CoA ligase